VSAGHVDCVLRAGNLAERPVIWRKPVEEAQPVTVLVNFTPSRAGEWPSVLARRGLVMAKVRMRRLLARGRGDRPDELASLREEQAARARTADHVTAVSNLPDSAASNPHARTANHVTAVSSSPHPVARKSERARQPRADEVTAVVSSREPVASRSALACAHALTVHAREGENDPVDIDGHARTP
jgi:hypothetical protein